MRQPPEKLATAIEGYLEILGDRAKLYAVMRAELTEIRDLYATPRLSEIAPAWDGIDDEDLIARELVQYVYAMEVNARPRVASAALNRAAALSGTRTVVSRGEICDAAAKRF